MLFPYTHIAHSMDKMQGYIDFIFYKVWCTARGTQYDIETLFTANNELKKMIIDFHTSEVDGANFFLTGLQKIFDDFKGLSDAELEQLKQWYHSNNNIELVCAGDQSVSPATYEIVATLSNDLSTHLKEFFKNLYSQSFLSLKSVKDRIGEIDNHYNNFMQNNIKGKCPFCGINDVKGIYNSKREAYDHFLPKGKYPFNTINFYNLVPTCHECNSSYKLTKNPLISTAGQSRKAFYPFGNVTYKIELSISLGKLNWTNIKPNDIKLMTGPTKIREEIDTWLDVYSIEERYKAKCCGENDGKGWISEVIDESINYGLTREQFLLAKLKAAENSPLVDVNFLKKPFLLACQSTGVFDINK